MRRLKRYEQPKVVDLTANDWNVPFGEGTSPTGAGNFNAFSSPGCGDGNSPGRFPCSTGSGAAM